MADLTYPHVFGALFEDNPIRIL